MDTDKQVVVQEAQSGAENAPMVLEEGKRAGVIQPEREADKEVVSSWQSLSGAENAPIPVESEYEDRGSTAASTPDTASPRSPSQKAPPPAYDTLERENSTGSSRLSIEPDGAVDTLPPRPEDRSAVGQLLAWIPSSQRTPLEKMPRLEKPVVIPQLDVPPIGESVPFQRCYSDVLAAHDVTMQEFTAFIDGLSVAQAPNSALQGLKMVGAGIGFVPIPLIGAAGRGITALAGSGSGKSSGRARLYLTRAMKEYFAPRGLRLNIVKDDDIGTRFLRIPTSAPRLAPLTQETLTDSICTRRLNVIAPYVAELRYDVPERDAEVKTVDRLAKKHLAHKLSQNAKEVARLREEQFKGRGFEGAMEEEKKCARLRWLVIEELK